MLFILVVKNIFFLLFTFYSFTGVKTNITQ